MSDVTSENFRKIKKKYLTVAIVAGGILGACLGIALTCTLAVIIKTTVVNFHWAIYIPIALALSAGAAYLFFLILRPDDKRIAKKLDRDFSLNQKVQTMVEFAGVEGDIHALQREQTNEALGEVAKKRVDLKWLLKFLFVPVIALAMLFAGIFTPAKKSAGYVDPGYSLTNAHATALENLIAEVEGSSLETGLNLFIRLELKELLDMLKEAEYQSAMKGAVVTAVHNIDGLVGDANSYMHIYRVFDAYEQLGGISAALVNGVVDYKATNRASLTSMKVVKTFEDSADERIQAVLDSWKDYYLSGYEPKAEGAETGTPLSIGEAAEKLLPFAEALTSGLAEDALKKYAPNEERQPTVRDTETGDGLYVLLCDLKDRLTALASSGENGGYEDAVSYLTAIKGAFTSFIENSTVALATQSYNCMMDDYIRNTLSRIFGISRAEFGSNAHIAPQPIETEQGGNGNDKEEGGGGWSSGDHRFGSDDEILDEETNETKKYSDYLDPNNPDKGTLYDKYFDRAMEYVADGACPEHVAAYIRQYFAYLRGDLETDGNS